MRQNPRTRAIVLSHAVVSITRRTRRRRRAILTTTAIITATLHTILSSYQLLSLPPLADPSVFEHVHALPPNHVPLISQRRFILVTITLIFISNLRHKHVREQHRPVSFSDVKLSQRNRNILDHMFRAPSRVRARDSSRLPFLFSTVKFSHKRSSVFFRFV